MEELGLNEFFWYIPTLQRLLSSKALFLRSWLRFLTLPLHRFQPCTSLWPYPLERSSITCQIHTTFSGPRWLRGKRVAVDTGTLNVNKPLDGSSDYACSQLLLNLLPCGSPREYLDSHDSLQGTWRLNIGMSSKNRKRFEDLCDVVQNSSLIKAVKSFPGCCFVHSVLQPSYQYNWHGKNKRVLSGPFSPRMRTQGKDNAVVAAASRGYLGRLLQSRERDEESPPPVP